MNFIQKGKEYDMIGLGEVMLRLSPQRTDKISQSHIFEKNAGGSEFNVMSGAAMLGIRTALITKLPENKLGHYIRNMIRYGDVSDDHIVYDTSPKARLGVYYYEQGAYPRKASVIYDRAGSSMTTLSIDEIAPDIYEKTSVFHVSSISLALNEHLKSTIQELILRFKNAGVCISFDVNYRANLWDEETARKCIEGIFPYVDILFVSEETSRRMLQRKGSLDEIMKGYTSEYGCKVVATTQREVISPRIHNFGSRIYYNGEFYQEPAYKGIEVIDRIGSGDAYLSGALFGMIRYDDMQKAVEIGNAMAAVKNTVSGDMSVSSLQEIESIIKAHHATGRQDEMNR
ncbi:sugar kinase [Ructibacterium gallinarum]|uniref:Sugar kinase n=1 Tax=Ructibacterium gallinarum TaxID=2779355 RepID=A0A9D5R8L7_9FIRM|nr:sugar kinase [Ructibacterium gallinarum]MBE5040120.1 sugar kinase [Ructibacterium gallinarum]